MLLQHPAMCLGVDEKLQDVFGHFQKDFEDGVSAENLGTKFGSYGSFLPTYQRSPIWSRPRSPPKNHNYSTPKSPNNLHLEGSRHNSVVPSSASLSARHGPSSTNVALLPSLRIIKKSRPSSDEFDVGVTVEDDESDDGDGDDDDGGRPDSVDDKVRKKEMRKGIDLATTLERIEKNFVITDPRLPDNPIIFASDSFLELTEYSREEILGRNCRFLQGPETDPATVRTIRHAIHTQTDVTVQLINYTKTESQGVAGSMSLREVSDASSGQQASKENE